MRILTYGTFDLFHIGHLNLLQRAKSMGDELYVGVSTDEFNGKKNKKSIISYYDRKDIVRSLDCVDYTFAEEDREQKENDIIAYDINVLVMGNDWEGKFDHLKDICGVVYLPRTAGISTSEIKDKIIRGHAL